jgi:hypothetical protein
MAMRVSEDSGHLGVWFGRFGSKTTTKEKNETYQTQKNQRLPH